MNVIIRIYSVVLLAYTGWRTYDFISAQLPKNDINFWLSIAFLFATEVGLILWHETHLRKVTTREQEYITRAMTWVDFVGSLAAGTADMILRQTLVEGYTIPPAMAQFLLYGLPIIMATNVAAVILYEQSDAETQQERAEAELTFEIHRQAIRDLRADRKAIATAKKTAVYSRMRNRVTGRVDREYRELPSPAPPPEPSVPLMVPDGHKPYPAETGVPPNPTSRRTRKS